MTGEGSADKRPDVIRRFAGWLTSSGDAEPEVRNGLLDTLIQRRPAVYFSSGAIMIMSLAAAVIIAQPWAYAWFAADGLLTARRLQLSFSHDNGVDRPTKGREAVVLTMFLAFVVFGFGCAGAIASGHPALAPMAVISIMGVFAGLISRWAAFPRLAIFTISLAGAPVCLALAERAGGGIPLAAIQFLLVGAATGVQIVQNHNTLLRMLRAEYSNGLLARTDLLTGLGNRAQLIERLEADCAQLRGAPADPACRFALLYVDLDGFKPINDSFGHVAGDRLLERIGGKLREVAGPGLAYRVGGDEFVILVPQADADAAAVAARRIIAAISMPHDIGLDSPKRVMASVGVALAPADGTAPDMLVSRADHALYRAKRAGKARHRFHGDDAAELYAS